MLCYGALPALLAVERARRLHALAAAYGLALGALGAGE
jgi:hypothetical protein